MNTKVVLVCLGVLFCKTILFGENKIKVEKNVAFEGASINFNDVQSRKGWFANPWGGGEITYKIVNQKGDKFPWALKVIFKNTKATLSNKQFCKNLKAKWEKNTPKNFYCWYKTSQIQGRVQFVYISSEDQKDESFTNNLTLVQDGKWHWLQIPLKGWNKNNKNLNIKNLKNIHFIFHGSGTFELGELGTTFSSKLSNK